MKTKKVRTIKDLQNHPIVDKVFKEWNPGIFDGYEYTYWLWLKDGYWFKYLGQCSLHEPSVARLCNAFNDYQGEISKSTDRF